MTKREFNKFKKAGWKFEERDAHHSKVSFKSPRMHEMEYTYSSIEDMDVKFLLNLEREEFINFITSEWVQSVYNHIENYIKDLTPELTI